MVTEPDGLMRMDVRLHLRTDDGALVAIRYFGPAQHSDTVRRALAANEPTGFADQSIRTHWLLKAGDPRYAWVNRTVFVGKAASAHGSRGLWDSSTGSIRSDESGPTGRPAVSSVVALGR